MPGAADAVGTTGDLVMYPPGYCSLMFNPYTGPYVGKAAVGGVKAEV